MIIFGFRSFVKTLAMLTLVCGRCGNPAAHRLAQRSRFFTLFFIPLIPMGFTRYTVCTFCGTTHKVSKQDAQNMIAASQQPPAYPGAPTAGPPVAPMPAAMEQPPPPPA